MATSDKNTDVGSHLWCNTRPQFFLSLFSVLPEIINYNVTTGSLLQECWIFKTPQRCFALLPQRWKKVPIQILYVSKSSNAPIYPITIP